MGNTDYMWVEVGDWEFGRMHDELRSLGAQGWELDNVIDEMRLAPMAGGQAQPAVCLRLKRERKYQTVTY